MTKGWIKGHECHEFLDEVHECLIWIAGVADENILDMHLKRILENIRHVLQVWTLKSTFIGLHVTWASQLLHLHRTTHSFWLACNILCGNEEFKWYPVAAAAMFPAYYEFIPVTFPFWGGPAPAAKTESHQFLKPTTVHSNTPINLDQLDPNLYEVCKVIAISSTFLFYLTSLAIDHISSNSNCFCEQLILETTDELCIHYLGPRYIHCSYYY
ncbi:unnamed protein product [Lactuca saligna]|uniref:Uncharacterized protein n=1 Tax=Lactuca saligna TaxID=75948 RepID=A0AA35VHP0_LACSI|nr:unnamed protein product [Lactuca saligna]